jgi:hypothetical protein
MGWRPRLRTLKIFAGGERLKKLESEVYKFMQRVVQHWDRIPIRIFQDGKWQDLFLCEIKDDKLIAQWVITTLSSKTYSG